MIRVKIENTMVDESKALEPVSKIIAWYKNPANKGGRRDVITKTLDSLDIDIDDLTDMFSDLSWGTKVNLSRAVRGW